MNLNRRIVALEKVTHSEIQALHVVTVGDDETLKKASTRYCQDNNLDEEKFINGDLGMVMRVIHE